MNRSTPHRLIGPVVALTVVLLASGGLSAATFTVTSSADLSDLNTTDGVCSTVTGSCTLRAAIEQANALAGADIIYENSGRHIVLGSSLNVQSEIIIDGAGSNEVTGTRIDANDGDYEAIIVNNGGRLVIQDVRLMDSNRSVVRVLSGPVYFYSCVITGGHSNTGGGILGDSSAEIILSNTEVSHNHATQRGGGIAKDTGSLQITQESWIHANSTDGNGAGVSFTAGLATDQLTVNNSTISGNSANTEGGGIYANGGKVWLDYATVRNNIANQGGGLYSDASRPDISNSTFSGNTVTGHGGGLFFNGNVDTAYVTSSTISGNSADGHGGGIYLNTDYPVHWGLEVASSTITENIADADHDNDGEGGGLYRVDAWHVCRLRNTVLAGNLDMSQGTFANLAPDCAAAVDSAGYNFIGLGLGTLYCDINPSTGDQIGTAPTAIDPMLGPLMNDGHYTHYHQPLNGSPLIDRANPDGCVDGDNQPILSDQRGEPREVSFSPDIGSVETTVVGRPVLTVDVIGAGAVWSTPAGIECGADCTEDFAFSTVVMLSTTTNYWYDFQGWSGDADCSDGFLAMNDHMACTATFVLAPSHEVTVEATGNGSGMIRWHHPSGNVIDSTPPYSNTVRPGDTLTLEPLPDTGSVFAGWSGHHDCADGVLTVNSDMTCIAQFDLESGTDLIFDDGFETGSLSAWTTGS
jgi:hypothetical protein